MFRTAKGWISVQPTLEAQQRSDLHRGLTSELCGRSMYTSVHHKNCPILVRRGGGTTGSTCARLRTRARQTEIVPRATPSSTNCTSPTPEGRCRRALDAVPGDQVAREPDAVALSW
ncbi:hypothetical protein C8Q80DRAFT_230210 [Daedaleopsis nitida]|nr:hypothetical protein C8Q80DRAFT_230210 [Daedaleopsis nitida]